MTPQDEREVDRIKATLAQGRITLDDAQFLVDRLSASSSPRTEPTTCPKCSSSRILTWLSWPGLWVCYDCCHRWRQPSTEPSAECAPFPSPRETASQPEGWRCFHCGMVLTTEQAAREHFGKTRFDVPACEAIQHPAVQALQFQHYHALKALRDVLSDLVDACYTEGSSSAWRLCGVCETEHHREATFGDQTHTKGCAVDEAEKVLRKPIELPASPARAVRAGVDLEAAKALLTGLAFAARDGRSRPLTERECDELLRALSDAEAR